MRRTLAVSATARRRVSKSRCAAAARGANPEGSWAKQTASAASGMALMVDPASWGSLVSDAGRIVIRAAATFVQADTVAPRGTSAEFGAMLAARGRSLALLGALTWGCARGRPTAVIGYAFPRWGEEAVRAATDEVAAWPSAHRPVIRIIYDTAFTSDPADVEVQRAQRFAAMTDLVCRLLLEKKKRAPADSAEGAFMESSGASMNVQGPTTATRSLITANR